MWRKWYNTYILCELGAKYIMSALTKIFGTHSDRELKRITPLVDKVESYRDGMKALSDEELRGKTKEYKERLEKGETLDDLLPEAYATVREAASRVLGMEHYRVQIIGGIILHQGRIAEMKTGEGKTLVSTLPAYLNALEGKGVYIVTVNDYLAKRDSEWMGKVHEFLGLTVGVVLNDMSNDERRDAYNCDITYITNNELGFDYLRDNMVIYKEQLVQRGLHYAIIDEVDSVLIDEARTPLIISGQSGKSTKLYEACDILAQQLTRGEDVPEYSKMDAIMGIEQEETGDFIVNEKDKLVNLTQQGVEKVEKFFHIDNLADPENLEIQHNVILALRAHYLMFRDQDYVVKDDQVMIVDEFTGRIMPGRRYSDGLHQAIEAKEHVKVKRESKTLATITFQNFFNKFEKKAGMTGTALTEEKEFRDIYGMDVIEIPTNRPIARIDHQDAVYKTKKEKFKAVVEEVKEAHEKGQPVLVGTITIETSELISGMLKREGIPHTVLNAKFHEQEAEIVAQAGQHGAVTIATNMAGRGTDIMLGGNSEYLAKQEMRKFGYSEDQIEQATAFNETEDQEIISSRNKFKELKTKYDNEIKDEKEKVISAGGLKILGTERHESRRIDNQLRGRSGRQGDPGESRFYISLDDDLMKIFGGDMITRVYDTLGADENMPIESKIISNAVENAQKKVEGKNFSIRKNVLSYDDVMNVQRTIIYDERRKVLDGENLKEHITKMMDSLADATSNEYLADTDNLNIEGFEQEIKEIYGVDDLNALHKDRIKAHDVAEELKDKIHSLYNEKEKEIGEPEMRELERVVMLKIVDDRWMDHIDAMDELKDGIGLQAYGQKDPVVQYRIEGFDMFEQMNLDIQTDVVKFLMNARKREGNVQRTSSVKITGEGLANQTDNNAPRTSVSNTPVVNNEPKVGRNDPCPCGSGKKYKNCCGK